MGIVLMLHSLWRWAVVIVALIALVKFGAGWLQRQNPTALDNRLAMIFTTVIDVQVLLGIVLVSLVAINGQLNVAIVAHVVVMVIVAIVAHLTAMWRKRSDSTVLRNNFLDVAAVLVLIVLGVSIVGGWHL
jgi:hypothetical protein